MEDIKIEFKISDTEKEIYGFRRSGNTYYYASIMYSNRDDKKDKWGEVWHSKKALNKEMEAFAKSRGYPDLRELRNSMEYINGEELFDLLEGIKRSHNACCNKTKHGKVRHHGCSWGRGNREDKYKIKLSKAKVKLAILEEALKVKVIL